MNSNTSGALLVAILAVAGFAWGNPFTVWACVATCAAAFLAEDLRAAPGEVDGLDGFDLDGIATALALVSWAGVAVAAIALMF